MKTGLWYVTTKAAKGSPEWTVSQLLALADQVAEDLPLLEEVLADMAGSIEDYELISERAEIDQEFARTKARLARMYDPPQESPS